MPITVYPLPPQLTYSPYLDALYAACDPQEFIIDRRSPRRSVLTMLFRAHPRILHLHFFDAIIQRPSKFVTWLRMVAWIMLLMLLRWRGVKIVWTAHNIEPHECYHPNLAQRTIHHLLKQCHAVTVHHHATKRALLELYGERAPITVIPHGHAVRPFGQLPSRHTARQQLGFDTDTPVFLYLGLIRRYKGIEQLIDAMELLPHVHMVVAGHPSDRVYLSELHQMTARRINVTLRPRFLPDQEAAQYLAACNALILPYRQITTSGMLVAAQSAGITCIVPNLPPLLEQVKDGVTGFVYHAEHTNSLIQAIERCLESEGTEKIGAQARASLAKHTWPHIAQQFMRLYHDLSADVSAV